MFTNWLTNSTNSNNNQNTASLNSQPHHHHHHHPENMSAVSVAAVAAASISASNTAAAAAAAGLMSSPPDVVLEVGPAPGSVRFVAHSIVLGMHSGYLRSAIRLDEHVALATNGGTTNPTSPVNEIVLYLSNVTAEQFAPLLTYMYTGYLDLNIENIFGVLLATHVLHMPRALEICRSFLARAQSEGYLGNSLPSIPISATATTGNASNCKIIRPIASKATIPNFGFGLPTPTTTSAGTGSLQQQLVPIPAIYNSNNASFVIQTNNGTTTNPSSLMLEHITRNVRKSVLVLADEEKDEQDIGGEAEDEELVEQQSIRDEIDVERNSTKNGYDDNDEDLEDDIEVFIDNSSGNSDTEELEIGLAAQEMKIERVLRTNEKDFRYPYSSSSSSGNRNRKEANDKAHSKRRNKTRESNQSKSTKFLQQHVKSSVKQRHSKHGRSNKVASKVNTTSGLQVAKAPVPASQLLEATESTSKVIIDVASCDGPVRFRRILNTAYGHKPETFSGRDTASLPERTQQSVSYSFHQQMAKTISEQRQQLQQAEESENSESSAASGGSGRCGGAGEKQLHASSSGSKAANHNHSNNNEIYVCVYCKHTFKSQYCYQKHAKRHLNPLTLNCASTSTNTNSSTITAAHSTSVCDKKWLEGAVLDNSNYTQQQLTQVPPIVTTKQYATELLRREVRPLDMNVQYYPCKTCGSKFPSYYFVHKHRKMCHADEEQDTRTTEGEHENRRSVNNTNTEGAGNGGKPKDAERKKTPK